MKTYSELGIRKTEYNALIRTRDILMLPEIEHVENPLGENGAYNLKNNKSSFNMSYTAVRTNTEEYECGTCACIGGWMAIVMNGVNVADHQKVLVDRKMKDAVDTYVYCDRSEILNDLFLTEGGNEFDNFSLDLSKITQKQAVETINHFLETGEIDWERSLKDSDALIYYEWVKARLQE